MFCHLQFICPWVNNFPTLVIIFLIYVINVIVFIEPELRGKNVLSTYEILNKHQKVSHHHPFAHMSGHSLRSEKFIVVLHPIWEMESEKINIPTLVNNFYWTYILGLINGADCFWPFLKWDEFRSILKMQLHANDKVFLISMTRVHPGMGTNHLDLMQKTNLW